MLRRFAASLVALASIAAPSLAHATATEPNGLQVPLDSMNGEVQLYTFFQQQADPVDWIADGHTTPSAFSPLCGFGATFVLNQAGSHLGLAWYNETGSPPPSTDLHTILPAGSPVGATFSGTAIRNDPAYTGGLVGFALVGGETHYTNPQYDVLCSACNPPGPWITAIIYPSKTASNTYYVAFEDGSTSASVWNNDGDFNDDVFKISGITCSGGGLPCDTGKPGICALGITSCTANGVVCQQVSQPAAMKCNGLDNDCNGVVDDGPCAANEVCSQGKCTPKCDSGEFQCSPGLACDTNGLCVEPACVGKACPAGQTCSGGHCVGVCDGITCPFGHVCRAGMCADPCAGVTCDTGSVCEGGACITRCDCAPCAAGKACDATSGHCGAPVCVGKSCSAGQHCDPSSGACVDDCAGATCPKGQQCTAGACVAIPTPDAGADADDGGNPFGDGGVGPYDDAGDDAGASDATPGDASDLSPAKSESSSGCGCAVPGGGSASGGGIVALALAGLVASRRRGRARGR